MRMEGPGFNPVEVSSLEGTVKDIRLLLWRLNGAMDSLHTQQFHTFIQRDFWLHFPSRMTYLPEGSLMAFEVRMGKRTCSGNVRRI